jgi:hypothetical protein
MKKTRYESEMRLKKLLEITGLKGSELAKLTGTSYPLFLKVHGGDRAMSLEYAELIMTATGINPQWLMGKRGSLDAPKTIEDSPFSSETYAKWRQKGGQLFLLTQSLGESFETVPVKLRRMAWEVVRLGIASARTNRLYVTVYHFTKFINETKQVLGIEKKVTLEEVKFLPDNPYNSRLNVFKNPIKENMFESPDESDEDCDLRPTLQILSIFNPTFLFELSEGVESKKASEMAKRLEQAQESLDILKAKLLQSNLSKK